MVGTNIKIEQAALKLANYSSITFYQAIEDVKHFVLLAQGYPAPTSEVVDALVDVVIRRGMDFVKDKSVEGILFQDQALTALDDVLCNPIDIDKAFDKEFGAVYEYDKASGHVFCKYCGNNYLLKEHKPGCKCSKEG